MVLCIGVCVDISRKFQETEHGHILNKNFDGSMKNYFVLIWLKAEHDLNSLLFFNLFLFYNLDQKLGQIHRFGIDNSHYHVVGRCGIPTCIG